jgi:hypothetical protein
MQKAKSTACGIRVASKSTCFAGGLRIDGEVHGNVVAEADARQLPDRWRERPDRGRGALRHLVVNGDIKGRSVIDGTCLNSSLKAAYMGMSMLPFWKCTAAHW